LCCVLFVMRSSIKLFTYTLDLFSFYFLKFFFIIIWFVRLLALRPLLAYCASLGWQWRWLWRSRWNVYRQGKPKFSEKTFPSATFVHHKIPHDQTRVWTWAAAAYFLTYAQVVIVWRRRWKEIELNILTFPGSVSPSEFEKKWEGIYNTITCISTTRQRDAFLWKRICGKQNNFRFCATTT
jgi:hypothetical protein